MYEVWRPRRGWLDRRRTDALASAAAGDEVAFRRIITAYHDDMRKVCMAIADDRAIADEATQAAWVIAWKRLGDVRDEEHLRPWLVTVAANETKQLARSRRRRAKVEVAHDATHVPGGSGPSSGVVDLDVRDAMDRLDPDDRTLLALRYVAGFDSNELGSCAIPASGRWTSPPMAMSGSGPAATTVLRPSTRTSSRPTLSGEPGRRTSATAWLGACSSIES